ncbi:MAG: protoglobin domain-containing protein [Thermogemmata sp.]|nr:protoglobin domain-containing protein [Thermogemmata sp.]
MSSTLPAIPGYSYGQPDVPSSPLSLTELEQLKQAVLWTSEDEKYLRQAGAVLADQVDAILDLWYGFVAAHPHLLRYFADHQGQPIPQYLEAVRRRFGQWILDTCLRPHDQDWLNYQYEIGLRHHRTRKNRTDQVTTSATAVVPLRYLVAFIVPITVTIRDFLARKGHSADEVDKMYHAWFKAVTLQVALWCQPYVFPGDY